MMPFGMAKPEETEMSDKLSDGIVSQMRKAADRTKEIQGDEESRNQDAHIDSMKTTDAHVGKASQEPHKSQEQEDAKADKKRTTGDQHVKSAPLRTHGQTTDEVTTSPEGARPGGGGHVPQTMVDRATRAAEGDATGGAPKGDTRSSKKKKKK